MSTKLADELERMQKAIVFLHGEPADYRRVEELEDYARRNLREIIDTLREVETLRAERKRWMNALETLREENDILRSDAEADDRLRSAMRELLTGTANALKGEPAPMSLHDWSDLPKVAATLRADLAKAQADAAAMAHLTYHGADVVDGVLTLHIQLPGIGEIRPGTTLGEAMGTNTGDALLAKLAQLEEMNAKLRNVLSTPIDRSNPHGSSVHQCRSCGRSWPWNDEPAHHPDCVLVRVSETAKALAAQAAAKGAGDDK